MHFRYTSFAVISALSLFATTAFAQVTMTAVGVEHGTESKFIFSVDPSANTLTIKVDNTILGAEGVQGTITSFGFNTPFTDAQLGNNGSAVSFTQNWTVTLAGHSTSKWNIFEPYQISQNGGYAEDLGVGTGNTPTGGGAADGIKFGEKATFVFTFPDFGKNQVSGFFDNQPNLVVRWQEVGIGGSNGWSDFGTELPPTPEPSTYGLMGAVGLVALVAVRRRKEKRAAAKKLVAASV